MGRGPEKSLSKEGMPMANRHTERCSTSLIARETRIKVRMRYHLAPVRTSVITKPVMVRTWRRENPYEPLVGR